MNSTPSWEIARIGTSSALKALTALAWVCTLTPTSSRAAITARWTWLSRWGLPSPSRLSPRQPTSSTRSGVTSSKDQPAAFIHTPRPSGSRTATCPQTRSDWPAAASAPLAATTTPTGSSGTVEPIGAASMVVS